MIKFISDPKLVLLFLSGNVIPDISHTICTVIQDRFDDLGYIDPPSAISIHQCKYNMIDNKLSNNKNERAIGYHQMILTWRDENERMHHPSHPAYIKIENAKYQMDNGQLIKFTCDRLSCTWYIHGKEKRTMGPQWISIKNASLIDSVSHGAVINFTWFHPNNMERIDMKQIKARITATGVNPDFLAMGDTVFKNDMDAMFFYAK